MPDEPASSARSDCSAPRHDTWQAYQVNKCRCPQAKRQQSRYRKHLALQRHRGNAARVPALGTLRRLEALQAMGWPRHYVLRRALGYMPSWDMASPWKTVLADTARRIDGTYRELLRTPGPSSRTRTIARAKGYAPPFAWTDIDNPYAEPEGVAWLAETG